MWAPTSHFLYPVHPVRTEFPTILVVISSSLNAISFFLSPLFILIGQGQDWFEIEILGLEGLNWKGLD